MTYHTPGATWQNVWARSPGSTRGCAVGARTVPDVPQLDTASPGVMAPTPAAPHALSAPPPTTGVPGARPVSAPGCERTRPSTSDDPPTAGNSDSGSPTDSRISRLQRTRAGSNIKVPEASEGS